MPFIPRPFAGIAAQIGVTEAEIIARIGQLQQSGLIRRLGGVFNSSSLGYRSCLCAVNVPENEIEHIEAITSPEAGVTHSYIRDGEPNFWFTYTAHHSDFESDLQDFQRRITPFKLLALSAVKKFKVQVIFDKTEVLIPATPPAQEAAPVELSAKEQNVVRLIQGNIPASANLFENLAFKSGFSETELITLLAQWRGLGILKRFAAIIRHRQFGFKGNAMCVWNVAEANVVKAGEQLAECSEVSHCYQREMLSTFPYNLFAMIHAESEAEVREKFIKLSSREHLGRGRMFLSTRELKKTSPLYFKIQK